MGFQSPKVQKQVKLLSGVGKQVSGGARRKQRLEAGVGGLWRASTIYLFWMQGAQEKFSVETG